MGEVGGGVQEGRVSEPYRGHADVVHDVDLTEAQHRHQIWHGVGTDGVGASGRWAIRAALEAFPGAHNAQRTTHLRLPSGPCG